MFAYTTLVEYRKLKNSIELGGSFKKGLASDKTPEEIEVIQKEEEAKIIALVQKVSQVLGENITLDNVEDRLTKEAQDAIAIVEACRTELKQAALDANLTLTSCIYTSPEQLTGGKLQTSKDVLNIVGELGNWAFAQEGTLVDNPYMLRKSGKGVMARGGMCMPGDTELLKVQEGRATLKEPVYVYLMKTTQFEPVVTIDYMPNRQPAIRLEGEWTSDKDIERKDMRVKKYTDVTEMLEYMQLFSAKDRETYIDIATNLGRLSQEQQLEVIKQLLTSGKLQYLNGECGINVDARIVPIQNGIKKSGYEDCIEDDMVRISLQQEAVQNVKEMVANKSQIPNNEKTYKE